MAAFYREITMQWGGKTYTVTPTYRMVQSIEQRLSIAGMIHRVGIEDPPLSQLADLLAIALQHAGCKDEDLDAEAIHMAMYRHQKGYLASAGAVLYAMVPEDPLPEIAEQPGVAKKKKGKKKSTA